MVDTTTIKAIIQLTLTIAALPESERFYACIRAGKWAQAEVEAADRQSEAYFYWLALWDASSAISHDILL